MSGRRLALALGCYALLSTAAWLIISDRDLRLALWVFLAGLAVKSWLAWKQNQAAN